MTFDPVHDTQAVHRALVKAFSFPGIPVSVAGPASRFTDPGLPATLGAVALTLLDQDTTYFHPSSLLTELTGARRRGETEAAFLFVSEWDEQAWVNAFTRGCLGTLADPHLGATLVAWAPTASSSWLASGPGIEEPRRVELPGTGAWVEARRQACAEFPLGIDLLWVHEGAVTALPRTTKLTPLEGAN